jgi:predicted metal-dependent phosphotriesterase family hydrolase
MPDTAPSFIRTVRGDIPVSELGFTHCHEHLFVLPVRGVSLPTRLIIDDYGKTKGETELFRESGGRGIVDVQPFGGGRHAELLRSLSEETGLTIVAATGLHRTMFYPRDFWSFRAEAEELADLFVSEIEEGMFAYDPDDPFGRRTDIRAGIIKIATDGEGPGGYYGRVFEAAARAHAETGAPIITHTEMSRAGAAQAAFLMERGVPPGSIILSHMDRAADLDANLEAARLGVFLEYDTIARFKYHSDEEEAVLLEAMIGAGFGNSILLGMDVTRDRYLSYGGQFGLPYIGHTFLPLLRERGVDGKTLELMTVHNPRRALETKEARPPQRGREDQA